MADQAGRFVDDQQFVILENNVKQFVHALRQLNESNS
jgi:hypothetical protein